MSTYKDSSEAVMYDKNGLPIYGMDLELAKKQASRHDPEKEAEVRSWIEAVTGEKFASKDFQESLKDGILLCKLINKIKPGAIPKINTSKLPFMQMENIGYFLKAAADMGLQKHDSFMTVDLYEGKNLPQVTQSLYIFGSVVQKLPGYKLPRCGLKLAEKREIEFTEEQLRMANAEVGQQYMASIKHDTGRSISREVVKTRDVGDQSATKLLSEASIKHDTGRSISREVVKVGDTGDKRFTSQQNEKSISHGHERSIHNEVVKIKPSTSSSKSNDNLDLEELEKLASLRDKGILTEEEFQAKKRQILGL
ncbi:hypothetical protein FDP41_001788 [Naegleria fowleri]|uniref:Calponin-homology (CH) domain-containing protein n=1 Tax=Naegleria fowleri TaxID=5763 RepID=A0A6A5C1N3_NAEFO|nr:uncharacterized protein FDP41_001788 [Naegleria fowleri]KAF0979445.1 hypothetical protein FDP41_001788 [Naegleria fowleri]CAG4710992.1 unnamed protein product [Naegleria fowleri]